MHAKKCCCCARVCTHACKSRAYPRDTITNELLRLVHTFVLFMLTPSTGAIILTEHHTSILVTILTRAIIVLLIVIRRLLLLLRGSSGRRRLCCGLRRCDRRRLLCGLRRRYRRCRLRRLCRLLIIRLLLELRRRVRIVPHHKPLRLSILAEESRTLPKVAFDGLATHSVVELQCRVGLLERGGINHDVAAATRRDALL